MDKQTVSAEKKRLEAKLNELGYSYIDECYAVYMLRRRLLEKQGDFFAEALSDAENVTEDSFPTDGLNFPREIYVKLVKIAPHLVKLFPKIVSEGALIRLVSAFEYFVTSSVEAVLETYPDLVYDRFLGCGNPVQEQLKYLRESSLQKKLDFIAGNLKIRLDVENFNGKKLKEIIATRHVIIHNRSMVDDKYCKDLDHKTTFGPGDERPIDDQYLEDSARVLNSAVAYLTWELTAKYCGTVW